MIPLALMFVLGLCATLLATQAADRLGGRHRHTPLAAGFIAAVAIVPVYVVAVAALGLIPSVAHLRPPVEWVHASVLGAMTTGMLAWLGRS